MAIFQASKVVATLPAPLAADTLYLVRAGEGFDLYCTDSTGSIAHTLNSTGGAVEGLVEIDGGSASSVYVADVQEINGGDASSF